MTVSTDPRKPTARYYEVGGQIEKRIHGEPTQIIEPPADPGLCARVFNEGLASLSIRGLTPEDIRWGRGYPDRTPPVVKTKNDTAKAPSIRTQAVIAVRADELFGLAKGNAGRLTKQETEALRAVTKAEAETWIAAQGPHWLAAAKLEPAVALKLREMRGGTRSLGDLKVEPETDPAAAQEVSEELGTGTEIEADDAGNPSLDEAAD